MDLSQSQPGGRRMPNEDEVKRAEADTLQKAARNLEEKIFDTKDATLRLWERNRHLQQRVGGLERRMRVLQWLALGLLGGIAGLGVVLTKGQLSPLQRQVVVLQETVSSLQARSDEFAGRLKAGTNTATPTIDEARLKQVEQEVLAAVQQRMPEMLATAGEGSGQGRSFNEVHETLVRSAVGAAKGPTGEPLRFVVGKTDPQKTPW